VDEKRFLIEVLLRARDYASQVTQRVARSLEDITKAQDRSTEASRRAKAPLLEQVSTLERLVESHVREKKALEDSSRALRSTATARREAATEARKHLEELQKQAAIERAQATEREKRDIEEVRRIRLQIAERVASDEKKTKAFNRETKELRQQAALLHALNQESAAANQRRAAQLGVEIAQIRQGVTERNRAATRAEQAAGKEERAFTSISKAVDKHNSALDRARAALERTDGSFNKSDVTAGRFTRALSRMGIETGNARSGLRGLNAEFQGFQIALAIKYAQSLISALIALGAQFVAVAAAAGQAAIGIGAALAAGAAQSLPVIGLLVGAFARLASVMKVVKLQNQQQLTATHDAARAGKAQQAATDQIRSSEERVAEAHRATARAVQDLARTRGDAARQEQDAQREVTRARREAIRTVEDLMAAEEDAAQSLLRSQLARQQAIESGDVMGAVQADIDVGRARRDVRRATQDAAPARARGVEGIQAVQDAEERLSDTRRQGARQIEQAEERVADARRQERQATEDLSRTRREATDNLAQETAAVDKLADSLKQLSPAERELYRRILALQDTYRRIARPITDIITRAFTDVVDRVNTLLRDPRIARGFRNIAVEVARSIRRATGEAGGERSVGAFEVLSAEAARNIPQVTRILLNFFRVVRNLVLDAVPAFRLLLDYVEDYSERALDASRNSKGIRDFFITGVRYAKAFFDLGLAVANLLLTIAGRGGAASEGIRTIRDLTGAVEDLTDKARDNAGSIRHFFSETHDAFFAILGVVATVAQAMVDAFSLKAVQSFAYFLNHVIIPALRDVVIIMGAIVTVFHQAFALPGVAQVAEMAATFLLLARGLTVIRSAISSIGAIIPTFLRSMGLVVAAEEGVAAGFALTPLGQAVLVIGLVTAAVILLDRKLHFLAPTWAFIKRVAVDAFEAIKGAGEDVVNWFSDVWTQGLLYWIRWPFVKAFEYLRDHGVFRWIVGAASDMIGWFKDHFSGGGDFAIIGDLITLPFRLAIAPIRFAFRTIRAIVTGALDLIAGRFDDFGDVMSDFWSDFIDVGRGAISSLLDIVGDLLGALGEIPKIGGPFKAAAEDIHGAQQSIDDMRDSDKRAREERKKSTEAVKDSIPHLVHLRDRYQDAKDRLDKLTPGTRAYRRATHDARDASKDYNEALKDTAAKAGGARQPVGRLRRNIGSLGDTSAETAAAIAHDLNAVLEEVGAKKISISVRRARRRTATQQLGDTDNPLLGSPFPRYMGGMANPYGGSSRDDHLLFDPYGRPIAAMSGTEGIVNAPQMGAIDSALGFAKSMGAMPWGSLNELWGSGMRHFQSGGGLKPAILNLSNRLDKMFGLRTSSRVRPGGTSYHRLGLAADVTGTPQAMARASRYIRSSGIWHSLLEGIHNPGLSVKNGQMVPASFWGASTWGDHVDHIHLALSRAVSALSTRIRAPRLTGLGDDALSRVARGGARTLTRAANRYVQRQMARLGGGDPRALGADANVVAAFRRAMRVMRANPKERLAGWEAGIVESGLKNLHYGDRDSLGSLQERASIFGRAHALNPFASMVRFLRDAISRRPWRGSAGSLAQAVQRSAFPGRYDQVRGQAMRYMQTGGPLGAARRAAPIGVPGIRSVVTNAVTSVLDRINELVADVVKTLEGTTRGSLRRSKRLASRIQRVFARLTGDGGLLDQMRDQVERVVERTALQLQRRQFVIGPGGPRRVALGDTEVARAELEGLQTQRGALRDERGAIRGGVAGARRALAEAHRRHNKRAEAAAQAALNNLEERLRVNSDALAQNAQDQVEAQERFQQSMLDAVNEAADRQNAATDRWSRMARALGQRLDPNAVIGAQIGTMTSQIEGLTQVVHEAGRTGNVQLRQQAQAQIEELYVQIAEAQAQAFQNSIDAVNNEAQRQTTQLDRRTRIAQLGGRTDFAALGGILQQRGGVLQNQRAGLIGLLGQAQAAGNVEQIDNLVDQIDELNVQLAENTQAVQDNSDAAFNFTTQLINQMAEFQQSVFGGAQAFFQALTARTGIDTLSQQVTALQGILGSLRVQQQGLLSQLISLAGLPRDAAGLTGADLVNYLVSISSGPAFDAIMAGLDPTQQDAFRDLVNALISNATAVEQNTGALNDITQPGAQSFASTLWTTFRQAVFTGAGGLLPNITTTVPTATVGARVLASGVMIVHAGEEVRPAAVSRDYRSQGGDIYNMNVTTPTEVLNPTDVGRQLAFYRKTQRRR
jgi:hypothetical protein